MPWGGASNGSYGSATPESDGDLAGDGSERGRPSGGGGSAPRGTDAGGVIRKVVAGDAGPRPADVQAAARIE